MLEKGDLVWGLHEGERYPGVIVSKFKEFDSKDQKYQWEYVIRTLLDSRIDSKIDSRIRIKMIPKYVVQSGLCLQRRGNASFYD